MKFWNRLTEIDRTLMEAATALDITRVRECLESGANVNVEVYPGSPLIAALQGKNSTEVALLLLEHGADPNSTDDMEMSALGYAVHHDDLVVGRRLLELGADPTWPDREGPVFIERAIWNQNHAMVALLLEFGANPHETFYLSHGAIDLARKHGMEETAQLMQDCFDGKVAKRGSRGDIMNAIYRDDLDYLKSLSPEDAQDDLKASPLPLSTAVSSAIRLVPELVRLGVPLPEHVTQPGFARWTWGACMNIKFWIEHNHSNKLALLKSFGILESVRKFRESRWR